MADYTDRKTVEGLGLPHIDPELEAVSTLIVIHDIYLASNTDNNMHRYSQKQHSPKLIGAM